MFYNYVVDHERTEVVAMMMCLETDQQPQAEARSRAHEITMVDHDHAPLAPQSPTDHGHAVVPDASWPDDACSYDLFDLQDSGLVLA